MVANAAVMVGALGLAGGPPAFAQIIYVDATSANTVQALDNGGVGGASPVAGSTTPVTDGGNSGSNNQWWLRTGFGIPSTTTTPPSGTFTHGVASNIVESSGNGGPENSPRLATTVTGLPPRRYEVFVYFWDVGSGGDWGIRAGLDDVAGHLPYFGSGLAGELASTAPATVIASDASNRNLLQVKIGVTNPNSTSITAFIDDRPGAAGAGNNQRTWYDGIGYRRFVEAYGDVTFDGVVDIRDYHVIRDNLGTLGSLAQGDIDSDGKVSLTDFHSWKEIYYYPFSPNLSSVPEPSSAALLAAGVALVGDCVTRRRSRRRKF